MKNAFTKSVSVALFAATLVAASAYAHDGKHKETEGKTTTVVGELIDTACFVASDGDAKGQDHEECASKCLGTGVPAGILPDGSKKADAMMILLTNPKVLAAHAAKTIKVEGTAHPKMHAFDVKKLYVKEGTGWKEVQLDDEHHKMAGSDDEHAGHKDGHAGHGDGKAATKSDGHAGHEHK